MYRQSDAAQDALMSDPELLGLAYAPSRAMPPKVTGRTSLSGMRRSSARSLGACTMSRLLWLE